MVSKKAQQWDDKTLTARQRYALYISSPTWRAKRQQRLDFDGGMCAICHEPATEVHHICYPAPDTYPAFGEEDVAYDLMSVCKRCHPRFDDKERGLRRYDKRLRHKETVETQPRDLQEANYGLARIHVQIDFECPVDNAQRANSGPNKQVVQIDETDFVQAIQDRRRL